MARQAFLEEKLYLEPDELQVALSKLGWNLPDAQIQSILKQFDSDGNGQIDKMELEALLLWLKKGMAGGAREDADEDMGGGRVQSMSSEIGMIKQENGVPTRDAFWIIPVKEMAYSKMLQIRKQINVLQELEKRLKDVKSKDDYLDEAEAEVLTDAGRAQIPSGSVQQTLNIVSDLHEVVLGVVSSLLMDLTEDDVEDVLAREGMPNKEAQKLVRECYGIEVTMSILEALYSTGIDPDWLGSGKQYAKVKEMTCYLYRLMKQTIKSNVTNSIRLFPFMSTISSHLGKGLSCMQVLKELFLEKRDLINKITPEQLEHVVELLAEIKDPRYIDFLMSICTCQGQPMPKIQGYITELLLRQNDQHLPQIKLTYDGNQRETIHILVHEKQESHPEWVDVSQFKQQIERRGKLRDLAGEIMSRPFDSLQPAEKKFRYFVRCTNLFGKLALGRNQLALRSLLFSEKLRLTYDDILRVMKMETLPLLVRARYTTLMRILYVDRGSLPLISMSHSWMHISRLVGSYVYRFSFTQERSATSVS